MHTATHLPITRPIRRSWPSTQLALTGGSLTIFLALAHVAADTVTSMFTVLLPLLQERFALTETVLALLVALFSVSTSITQPLFGAIADRIGRRRITALGIILTTGLLSLIGIVPTVYLLIGLLLLGGLGSAAFHPAGASLARMAGGRHPSLAISLFGAGGTLGLALGPVLILTLITTVGLHVTPWLMLPGIILGILTYYVVPDEDQTTRAGTSHHLDRQLITGPVGLLTLAATFISIVVITFSSAIPLWLVRSHAVATDDIVIGWTLATFSLAAAMGGVLAATVNGRVSARWLVPATMLIALVPLLAIFRLTPGTPYFYLAVMLAGGLLHASLPLLIVRAQDLTPHATATASGMILGFATGMAGLLYTGVGRLQEVVGLATALHLTYLLLIPGAWLAFVVLGREHVHPVATA